MMYDPESHRSWSSVFVRENSELDCVMAQTRTQSAAQIQQVPAKASSQRRTDHRPWDRQTKDEKTALALRTPVVGCWLLVDDADYFYTISIELFLGWLDFAAGWWLVGSVCFTRIFDI